MSSLRHPHPLPGSGSASATAAASVLSSAEVGPRWKCHARPGQEIVIGTDEVRTSMLLLQPPVLQ